MVTGNASIKDQTTKTNLRRGTSRRLGNVRMCVPLAIYILRRGSNEKRQSFLSGPSKKGLSNNSLEFEPVYNLSEPQLKLPN